MSNAPSSNGPTPTPTTAREASMAVFCDFENVALGVRGTKNAKFDIQKVLERLLVKGSIVAKKAYCDWDRYKTFKPTMHEAAFELIEIPHVRQSGKNSADIRMVVDALDLCYTKEHINTFVIISGDSDFSPLVSKLRENAKTVIGVGTRNSTSDLLMNNCDEFFFYEDLVTKAKTKRKRPARTKSKDGEKTASKSSANDVDVREAIDLVVETAEALHAERGAGDVIWGSMVKQTLRRRKPGFSESAYGFSSFSDLLEEAANRKALTLQKDERSGGYLITLM